MDSNEPITVPTPVIGESDRRLREKLRRELGPVVCALLIDPAVVEIMLNENGLLWVERQGEPMQKIGTMAASQAESVMATIAASLKTQINRDTPILECELPLDGSRFAGSVSPASSAPSFAIRKKATRIFTLADYVAHGIMSGAQRDALERAIGNHQNILVVGGTGSGKTTLTNALIAAIVDQFPHERIAIIEDTGEIQCKAENHFTFRAGNGTTIEQLLVHTLRRRPDRIVVGEVRDHAALQLLDAWNTGHPGGLSTIHSNVGGPKAALLRMESLVNRVAKNSQQSLIGEAVNVIVSIARATGGRRVQGVTKVEGWNGSQYVFTQLGE